MPKMSWANRSFIFPSSPSDLDDDSGGRHRKHRPQENAVEQWPLEKAANLVTDPEHQQDFQDSREQRRGPDLPELAQAELQPEREHQQDHPQLGKRLDRLIVLDERKRRRVRADDDPRQDVTEHYRLL